MARDKVTINKEQSLYVIPSSNGYSCLGFDVVRARSAAMALWLGRKLKPRQRGSLAAYRQYQELYDEGAKRCQRTGERCPVELTPQLVGLEGRRVEVVDCWGNTRRFQVGKSTGWCPIHLEIHNRRSTGGSPVTGAKFQSVRIIR